MSRIEMKQKLNHDASARMASMLAQLILRAAASSITSELRAPPRLVLLSMENCNVNDVEPFFSIDDGQKQGGALVGSLEVSLVSKREC